jgi:hypothetical protein
MSTLLYTKLAFFEAIFSHQNKSLDFISSPNAMRRLGIYQVTIREKLRNTLAFTFPGVWKILGSECANSVAYAFLKDPDHLPQTGFLFAWGEGFVNFLDNQQELQHLPYLKDYAMYEWLMHLAFVAESTYSVSVDDLNNISSELMSDMRFILIPSLYLYTAQYPIQQIQDMIEHPEALAIHLSAQTTVVVIAKPFDQVITFTVPDEVGLFFNLIKEGKSLGVATANTVSQYPAFNLSSAFELLLQYSLINHIES